MSTPRYVRIKFIWADGYEDECEVPTHIPATYPRRRETRGGRSEDAVPGVTAVSFRRVATATVRPFIYEEIVP